MTNWQEKTLGELGKVSMCKRVLKKQTSAEGDIPFYKIGTFGKTANAFIDASLFEDYKTRFSFPKVGDILISASGTIGRCVVYDGEPAYFQDSNIVWIDNDERLVSSEYLLHFYRSCDWNPSKGATISRLYNDDLRKIEIRFPPIPEQKRIVATLDQAFADIDKARANAEQNLKNVRELFDSYLQQVFSQRGEGWVKDKMSDVCEGKITDGTHQTPKYFDEGYIFLSSKNVTSGVIDWKNVKYLDEVQHLAMQKRMTPRVNDILLAKNGTTGVAAIVDKEAIFNIYVSLALLRPSKHIVPKYLLYFINSPVAKRQFNKRLKGIGVPNLHLKEIRDVEVSYPVSLEAQQSIVDKLDLQLKQRDQLESIYQTKLESLTELKKSILQKAFSGELSKNKGVAA